MSAQDPRILALVAKLGALPPHRFAEVEEFVDFLAAREARPRLSLVVGGSVEGPNSRRRTGPSPSPWS
jgi:hypothetical protein